MKCPYCDKGMESGVMQSQHSIRWQKTRYLFLTEKETDITLSKKNFWKGSAIRAYRCGECKKIIIDYSSDCDLNHKSTEKEED